MVSLENVVSQTQRNLLGSGNLLSQTLRKISTGQKYANLTDNLSVYNVNAGLDLNIKSLSASEEIRQKATDLINIADTNIQSISDLLSQMYELAVKAQDPLLSAAEQAGCNTTFTALRGEINTLATNASYGEVKLLDGTFGTKNIPIGLGSNISITLDNFKTEAGGLNIDGLNLTSAANATTAATNLSTLLSTTLSTRVSSISVAKSILSSTIDVQSSLNETFKAAKSRILDADVNEEMTNLTQLQIKLNTGISVLAQANSLRATIGLSLLGMGNK